MKITFVLAHAGLEGGVRVIATYAQRLKNRGHDVQIVSLPRVQPTWKQQLKSLLRGRGFISIPRRSPSHLDYIDVPHHLLNHGSPITDGDVPDADIVIATWWETAEWVANLSRSKGAKAYFIQHHEIFDYMPKERVSSTWRLPLSKITVSKWLSDLAYTEYGDNNACCIPNSVDMSQFYASPRGKQPTPTIGMIYASNYWKGCDVGLEAFTLATQKIPNLRFVIFGLEQLPSTIPLPNGVKFIHRPQQDVIRTLYDQCDAWLFPSRTEGFGLPILEAMACRTPVIGTPAGIAPEFLRDGAGILVKPEDPIDMAKAILNICQMSEQDWLVMSDAAYQKATSYTWEDATDRMEAALYAVIENQRSKSVSNVIAC